MASTKSSMQTPKTTGTFVVPDYYRQFQCKGGECRDSCCVGWTVTIPVRDYFRIHGLEVDKQLRDRIDRAFRVLPNPTPDRYAELVHTYDNDCPIHLKNGACQLHAKKGEEALPTICRLYPRGIRMDYAWEASTANSCEKTLELLMLSPDPLTFETIKMTVPLPQDQVVPIETQEEYHRIRNHVWMLFQNRSMPLFQRVFRVYQWVSSLDEKNSFVEDDEFLSNTETKNVDLFFEIMPVFLRESMGRNPGLVPLGTAILDQLEEFCANDYLEMKEHLAEVVGDSDIWFEKFLMNNLFFRQFPFQEKNATFTEEALSLVGTYLLMRLIALVGMKNKQTTIDFVDIMSKVFGVIVHTRFERNIRLYLQHVEVDSPASLFALLAV